jgi:hypothetical protein
MRLSSAIVRVVALEHFALGVVVGSTDRVLVPFSAVEVDRPGIRIEVYDVHGDRHIGRIAPVDRDAGLALLAVDHPIAATPIERFADPPRAFSIPHGVDRRSHPASDTRSRCAGDSMSAGLVWIGARTAMSSRAFIAINVALTLAWVGLALLLGRMCSQSSAASRSRDSNAAPAAA